MMLRRKEREYGGVNRDMVELKQGEELKQWKCREYVAVGVPIYFCQIHSLSIIYIKMPKSMANGLANC